MGIGPMGVGQSGTISRAWVAVLGVAATALAARLPIIYIAPYLSVDSLAYMKIAENIMLNGCVSYSPPGSGACVPNQGGHFPGITAITAAFWFIFGKSYANALLLQALVSAIAYARLAYAVFAATNSRMLALLVGLVVSLSPITLSFASAFRTDGYSVAAAAWVIAELMLSWHYQRIRVLWLAASLIFAVFMRLDGGLLSLFVPLLALKLHPWRQAAVRTLMVAALVAAPLTAWIARNVAAGLPPVLTAMATDGSPLPSGYMAWINTFVVDEEDTERWVHVATGYQYSRFFTARGYDASVFIDDAERLRFDELRNRLAASEGRPMPADIDRAFGELAERRAKLQGVFHPVKIIGQRALALWFQHPFHNYYWLKNQPGINHKVADALESGNRDMLFTLIWDKDEGPKFGGLAIFAVLIVVAVYRWTLLLAFFVLLYHHWRMPPPLSLFFRGVFVLLAAKTLSVALAPVVPLRYMIGAVPFMETAVILGAAHLWGKRIMGFFGDVTSRADSPLRGMRARANPDLGG